jgi:hypothetical protein
MSKIHTLRIASEYIRFLDRVGWLVPHRGVKLLRTTREPRECFSWLGSTTLPPPQHQALTLTSVEWQRSRIPSTSGGESHSIPHRHWHFLPLQSELRRAWDQRRKARPITCGVFPHVLTTHNYSVLSSTTATTTITSPLLISAEGHCEERGLRWW